jgi:hypothetical protein
MTKTTIAAAAVAALALPVGAQAGKPERPAKAAGTTKAQQVGFTAAGTAAAAPAPGATSLTLDLTRANKHARGALGLTRTAVAAAAQTTITDAVPGFRLVFRDGVTAATYDARTDRVRVVGRVARTRTKGAPRASRFTYGAIDVRRVVVTRAGR